MWKALLVLALALAFAAAPLLTPDFGGFDPSLYPQPQDDPPVQPKGYAFAIWGLIYAWLVIHAGFGVIARARHDDWTPTRRPLAASLLVGVPWLSVAMMSPVWASIMIWIMLVCAIAALLRAGPADHWLLRAPIGLYAGWLTAASFVSLGLLAAGWGLVDQRIAAWAAVAGTVLFAIAVQRRSTARTYGAAVVWAFIAIAVQNYATDPWLTGGALVAAALIAIVAAIGPNRRYR
ncbi:hypothetical protein [Profundibacterium mesophilum]|uniref:Tryptophan-rich sensory protein n=1 Tax=Profundibacterium mesophilum KAUST100406-0324 TaxID=1037889 RepID=A0A921NRC6_9RHOB|nr:hypothetical protein [Profundibacterium mesophilum]KAF0674824.1 hypothetical protein PMES_02900 [Profundibacterium mesophilum KAUST100406-0324]